MGDLNELDWNYVEEIIAKIPRAGIIDSFVPVVSTSTSIQILIRL